MSEKPQPDFDPSDVDGLDARQPEELSAQARMFVLSLQHGVHYPAIQASIDPETHRILPYHDDFTVKISPATAALLLANIPKPTSPFTRATGAVQPQYHAALDQSDGPG